MDNLSYLIIIYKLIEYMLAKTVFELSLKLGKKLPVQVLSHINENTIKKVKESRKFKDYIQRIQNAEQGVNVSKIEILGVQMFGEKVGFINLKATTTKDGFNLPSYVFLRGNAVAILMFVNQKLLVIEQYRVPIQSTITEAPAGMLDESGDFVGTAAMEIQQQTSIKLQKDKLISLGSYYPSVGGSDEQILMFYCKIDMPQQQMKQIEQKIHGKQGQSQKIKVKFVEYDPQIIIKTRDSKLICLMYAYEKLQKKPAI